MVLFMSLLLPIDQIEGQQQRHRRIDLESAEEVPNPIPKKVQVEQGPGLLEDHFGLAVEWLLLP